MRVSPQEAMNFDNFLDNYLNESAEDNFFNRQNSDREYFYENKETKENVESLLYQQKKAKIEKSDNFICQDVQTSTLDIQLSDEKNLKNQIFKKDAKMCIEGSSKTYDGYIEKLSMESSDNNLFSKTVLYNLPTYDLNDDNLSEICNTSDLGIGEEIKKDLSENDQINKINSEVKISNQNDRKLTGPEKVQIKSNISEDKVSEDSGPKKVKTTEFAYLLERKAFRMMRKYYKEKYEFNIDLADYKKRLPTMKKHEIDALVYKFMDEEFSFLAGLLTEKDFERTKDALKTIILCDRYKKKELISEGLDFATLRNVLHKYNTRNLIELISDASYSFLFTHFFLINGKKSAEEQADVDQDKLIQRMRHLMSESSNYLPKEINSLFEEIYKSIYN